MSRRWSLLQGHTLDRLRGLPTASVDCALTSPPYLWLRNYLTHPQIWDVDEALAARFCSGPTGHAINQLPVRVQTGGTGPASAKQRTNLGSQEAQRWAVQGECVRCGGWFGELGAEDTPERYVQHLVEIFRDLRRVLKPTGTFWLNIGDSYAGSGKGPTGHNGIGNQERRQGFVDPGARVPAGCKPKDLIGVPWMLAFALRADGWYLRADVIWHKPNPFPESVRDRPTRAHEYVFLLTPNARYHYDADAIREACVSAPQRRPQGRKPRHTDDVLPDQLFTTSRHDEPAVDAHPKGRNKRDVWSVNTQSYKAANGKHFAPMPEKLAEPCILAGCPEGGLVLDPFAGTGTTGVVAQRFGREFVGIELNAEYVAIAGERLTAAYLDQLTVRSQAA